MSDGSGIGRIRPNDDPPDRLSFHWIPRPRPASPEELREALLDLVQLRRPIEEAGRALEAFHEQSVDLVEPTTADVARLLDAYLAHRVTELDVEEWACRLIARSDVVRSSEMEELLFELDTPELYPFGPDRARDMLRRIERSGRTDKGSTTLEDRHGR